MRMNAQATHEGVPEARCGYLSGQPCFQPLRSARIFASASTSRASSLRADEPEFRQNPANEPRR